MVHAGMTPMHCIVAATLTAAEHIGHSKNLGAIETGKAADVIATASSPLDDVAELKNVKFVMRDGIVYKDAWKGAQKRN
jgi:imidazolonepropionase-like amidohydrolase